MFVLLQATVDRLIGATRHRAKIALTVEPVSGAEDETTEEAGLPASTSAAAESASLHSGSGSGVQLRNDVFGSGPLMCRFLSPTASSQNIPSSASPPSAATSSSSSSSARRKGGSGDLSNVDGSRDDDDDDDDDALQLKPIPPVLAEALRGCIDATLGRGPLLGYPLVGLRIRLLEGDCELSAESSPMAIRTAGARALDAALRAAGLELLEPLMAVDVTVPIRMTGDAISELSGHRRGRIQGVRPVGLLTSSPADDDNNGSSGASFSSTTTSSSSTSAQERAAAAASSLPSKSIVRALVPLREMVGFSTPLRSRTAGEGSFAMEFVEYAPVGPALQKAAMANPALL